MPVRRFLPSGRSLILALSFVASTFAQQPSAEDQAIDAMRALPQIGTSDQRRIQEWLDIQIQKVVAESKENRRAAANAFRKTLKGQFDNSTDSAAFRSQLRAQLAEAAAARFSDAKLDRWVGFGIARVLVDYNAIENFPGFIAGLKCHEELVRYLSAQGLADLSAALPGEKEKLDQVVAALKEAGQVETSPAIVARIYAALAYPAQVPAVFDAYMAIFDKRLAAKRAAVGAGEAGEIEAFEFFRNPVVLSALTPDQKNKLVTPLATFMRIDAERYDTADLSFDEQDRLERRLDAAESVLADIVGAGKGGKIRGELENGGPAARGSVRAEATKWVGDKDSKGALNDPPYNVPVGAP